MQIQDTDHRTLGLVVIEKPILTNGSGAASIAFGDCRGRLYALKVTSVDLDSGADWTLAGAVHGTIYAKSNTASLMARPRGLVQDAAGADIAGSMEAPYLLDEAVTLTVAQGGNAKTGTATLYLLRGIS